MKQVLLLNAGSSSLKFTLMTTEGTIQASGIARWSAATAQYQLGDVREEVSFRSPGPAVERALADLRKQGLRTDNLVGVGHRWVHGGGFRESVRVTPEVRQRLATLSELAPLHNPVSLEALDAAQRELPEVPHIVAFDTAFHASLPPEAITYAVPQHWTREWGIRRYGFHGLSYDYAATRAAEMLGGRDDLRLVVLHLGQGCSAAAIRGRTCVDTTMGFTPLEGLVMATRSGNIDPGVILHVIRQRQLPVERVEEALNHHSGLLGLSGVSGDMRAVQLAANEGNESARLALAVYSRRLRQAIGSLTAMLGGLDALIFTGGVGEHSAEIRADACRDLKFLGIHLDADANRQCHPDADIASTDSAARILVLTAREDLTLLREVQKGTF